MIPLGLCDPSTGSHDGLPAEYQAAIERFARYLAARQLSPHTQRLYVGAVDRWMRAGGAPGHVDQLALARWLATRRASLAVNTVNLDLKALRCFYRWQAASGTGMDGADKLIPRGRKAPQRVVRYLTEADVGEVLGSLPLDTFLGLRDHAIVRVLFECGLRATEVADMQLGSLLPDDTLFVQGKGGVDRYVPVSAELAGFLRGYMHARAGTKPGKRNALWVRENGRPLRNGRSIWEIVSRAVWRALGRRGGLHKVRATGRAWQGHYPHELRASFATALLRGGCPITAIAQMMGHADTSTTARYLGVDLEMLRKAAACHPRALRVADPA